MNALFLAFVLLQATPSGVVTGIVRTAEGKPAAGVRVYAMAVGNQAVFESLVQTDAEGRYRLEIAPGRYYIASGSLETPTYYPGTFNPLDARPLQIGGGTLIDNIDFGRFVAPPPQPSIVGISVAGLPPMPPGSKGVLSGVIRYPDGTPAGLLTVVAVPVSMMPANGLPSPRAPLPNGALLRTENVANVSTLRMAVNRARGGLFVGGGPATTDGNGRFMIENVPPDTYYIVTGYSDSPMFYPGVSELPRATVISTTPATRLDTLDFVVPAPGISGFPVSGNVSAAGGAPAAGAPVVVRVVPTPAASSLPKTLLPERQARVVIAEADGSFKFPNVYPGNYTVVSQLEGMASPSREITVVDRAVPDVRLALPIALLSGRILLEDGTPVETPYDFKEIVVTSADGPNIKNSTILSLSSSATFSRVLPFGEYRFYVRTLPEEYAIRSITADGIDLLRAPLQLTSNQSVSVDIRVARRRAADVLPSGTVNIHGTLNDISGVRQDVQRVTLCCRDFGAMEQYSAPVASDGSFEFTAVPPGQYTPGVQLAKGMPTRYIVTPSLVVGNTNRTQVLLNANSRLRVMTARIAVLGGGTLPPGATVRLSYHGDVSTRNNVDAVAQGNSEMVATLATDDHYRVLVAPPAGFRVKSIDGLSEKVITSASGRVSRIDPLLDLRISPDRHPDPLEIVLEREVK